MLFHSYVFLFAFLPACWLTFILLKRHVSGRAAMIWLTLASFFFYGWWNPPFVLLVMLSILVNFHVGRGLSDPGTTRRKALLWFGLLFNLIPLGYFKYAGFLAEIWSDLTGTPPLRFDPILPLAISFYTFQKVAYLVDAYKTGKAERDLVDFSLFVMFFPQLIAGPIVRHEEIIPQIKRAVNQSIRPILVAAGLSLVAVGLFKKVYIADHLSVYFAQAYPLITGGTVLSMLEAWLVMTACALQIYFDYSGYADMAAGLGLIFGVRMPLNFFSPYKATSPVDFWRRWNMTLMRFLRDYVYIPLGGSRYGEVRKYAASFTVMIVCGIWHGAGWNYIVWGAMVGTILTLNNLWLKTHYGQHPPGPELLRRWFGRALTFVCYAAPLAVFMFPQLRDGFSMLGSMFTGELRLPASLQAPLGTLAPALQALGVEFGPLPAYAGSKMLMWIAAGLVVLYAFPNSQQLFSRYRPTLNMLPKSILHAERPWLRWRPTPAWGLALATMVTVSLMFMHKVYEFFYFQF